MNQKGFSIIEVLIVLMFISMVALIGRQFYSYRNENNNPTTKSNSTQANVKSQLKNQTNASGYLTLDSYTVRLPLNTATSGLKLGTVTASGYNKDDMSIPIIAPDLDMNWKCEVNNTSKIKGTIGTISITTQMKRSGPYEPLVTVKIGNNTYGYEPSGSNCTDSPKYQQIVDAFTVQFKMLERY